MRKKKILAGRILKISPYKVKFDTAALEEIGKAITRSDLRGLIAVGKITKDLSNYHSRAGARKIARQKAKGNRKGKGSKKGSKNAKITGKEKWIARIRSQRAFIKMLKTKGLLTTENFHGIYAKCKGGYFRNIRHIKLYLTEHKLFEIKKA